VGAVVTQYEGVKTAEQFEAVEKKRRNGWAALSAPDKKRLKDASDAAEKRLKATEGAA
jgi:hypothetical protein